MDKVYLDTCVLMDILQPGEWTVWAEDTLTRLSENYWLVIGPSVFAEISVGFDTVTEVVALLAELCVTLRQPNEEALFLAGKKHLSYRRRGGTRTGTLSDFYIGAQASVEKVPLMTRDTRRFRTYFPRLELICPDS